MRKISAQRVIGTLVLLLFAALVLLPLFWLGVSAFKSDADVIKCLKMLTDVPLDQIAEMETWKDAKLNEAKAILAYELTKLVHGEAEAEKAQQTSQSLFSTGGDLTNMPTTELTADQFADGPITIVKLLTTAGLATSNKEAKTLIKQGGVQVNGEKVEEFTDSYGADAFEGDGLIVKKGKKVYRRFVIR